MPGEPGKIAGSAAVIVWWFSGGFAWSSVASAAVGGCAVFVLLASTSAAWLVPPLMDEAKEYLPRDEEASLLSLNRDLAEYRVVATHNSTHVCNLLAYLCMPHIRYTHLPLLTQLRAGLRGVELDIWYNRCAAKWEVQHENMYDCLVTTGTSRGFRETLRRIQCWSAENARHFPLQINLDVKGAYIMFLGWCAPWTVGKGMDRSAGYPKKAYDALRSDISSVFGESVYTPAHVRQRSAARSSLSKAVSLDGWGKVGEMAGRSLFFLNVYGSRVASAAAADSKYFFIRGHASVRDAVYFESPQLDASTCQEHRFIYRSLTQEPAAQQVALDDFRGVEKSVTLLT
ncbi:hypothetical protein DIPPA_12849 [Diplonema papillatum]|nr:hypothetical protein DIPPA_12849 [Diplonema papillatum]